MNFDPQKYFIGLIDLFSIWLPGAMLTVVVVQETNILGGWPPADASNWVGIILLSYIVGHFAFAIGSVLDSWIYDPLRRGTRDRQIDALAAGERASSRVVRGLAGWLFPKQDEPLRHALRLRNEHLGPAQAAGAINAFQWCKARLALEHGGVVGGIDRWEADSKFFRSLCAVILLLGLWRFVWLLCVLVVKLFGADGFLGVTDPTFEFWNSLLVASAGAILLCFALWRYVERRSKAITQAYWLVLAASKPAPPRGAAAAPAGGATHAGGVVLRNNLGTFEYLQVRASENWRREMEAVQQGYRPPAEEWVLPKGHIEPGETPRQTAAREVLEEAGILARIWDELGRFPFKLKSQEQRVIYYLMEYQDDADRARPESHRWLKPKRREKDDRPSRWCPVADVSALPPESQKAVEAAADYLPDQAA